MKNLQKGFVGLLVIAIAILVGVVGYFYFVNKTKISDSIPVSSVRDETSLWKSYTHTSSESGILSNITFKYPPIFGNNPTLISSRKTNRPENISVDWGGFVEFYPELRIEFFKRQNSKTDFETYVTKLSSTLGWDSPKYFEVNGNKAARLRFPTPTHYDGDIGWYFIELSNKNILEISTTGDKKFLYDDDRGGNSTRDKIISSIVIGQ